MFIGTDYRAPITHCISGVNSHFPSNEQSLLAGEPMEFDAPAAKYLYSGRSAQPSWSDWCAATIRPEGRDIADIGCGGGIYSREFSSLNARSVTGVDNSARIIDAARSDSAGFGNIQYVQADATATSLDTCSVDVVFERALIHHLSARQQQDNLIEAGRILRKNGLLVIQDRTLDDVRCSDHTHWIRSTLFASFPHLVEFERNRRPVREQYEELILKNKFQLQSVITLNEARKVYPSFSQLEDEILLRKGKSILFELSDSQLGQYCQQLRKYAPEGVLTEVDAWTIWIARSKG